LIDSIIPAVGHFLHLEQPSLLELYIDLIGGRVVERRESA
jgi:hypothetical protein